jgi:hypothetical protein
MPISLLAQDAGCGDPADSYKDLLNISNYDGCSKLKSKDRCDCIQKAIAGQKQASGEYSETVLKEKLASGYDQLQEQIRNNKKKYYNQFSSVYKIMTVNLAAQKMVLGIDSKPPVVGCTAQDMANGIRTKTVDSIDKQIAALKTLQATADGKRNSPDGALQRNKIDLLNKKIKKMEAFKELNSSEYCLMALNAIKDDFSREKISKIEFRARVASGAFRGGLLSQDKILQGQDEFIATLQSEASARFQSEASKISFGPSSYNRGFTNIANAKPMEDLSIANAFTRKGELPAVLKIEITKFDYSKYTNYQKKAFAINMDKLNKDNVTEADCSEVLAAYQKKVIPSNAPLNGGEAITNNATACKEDDSLCASFAIKNEHLNSEVENLYGAKSDQCLSYAEYVSFKGMPNPELIDLFAKMNNTDKLLDPSYKGFWARGDDNEKVRFLQANPIIAQLATSTDPAVVHELGKRIKKMAKEVSQHKGNIAEQFNSYMTFMKGGVDGKGGLAELYDLKGPDANMVACGNLQASFTAISLDNDERIIDESHLDKDSEEEVFACISKIYEGTNSSNLDATLEKSKLYQIAVKNPNKDLTKDTYNEFVKNQCANIEEIKALKQTMAKNNVKPSYDNSDLYKMKSWSNESLQNHEYKEEYHREVTSKLNHNVLETVFDKGEFEAAQTQNQAIQASQNVGEKFFARQHAMQNPSINSGFSNTSASNLGNNFEQSSDDSGQVRPNFDSPRSIPLPKPLANFDKMIPQKIQEAKSITDLDPSFNERPYEEKLSTYKALKDYVSEGGAPPHFSPSEEIKELEKSLEESKVALRDLEKDKEEKKEKEAAKVAQAQTSSSSASRAPANFQQASFVAPISNAPVLGQFPGSGAVVGSEAKLSKTEASYQAALMHKYDMNQNLQILIQGQDAVVKAPYDINTNNVLKADDVYPFSALNDPKKLSEFLAVKVGGSVRDGESVKIVDPASNSYFLLKATVKDGVTSYQRYPFVSEKDIRIVKLGDLHNTLKLNK